MPTDIPSIIRGAQDDYRALYFSEPMAALKVPVTLQAGYGLLKLGSALALNKSAGVAGITQHSQRISHLFRCQQVIDDSWP